MKTWDFPYNGLGLKKANLPARRSTTMPFKNLSRLNPWSNHWSTVLQTYEHSGYSSLPFSSATWTLISECDVVIILADQKVASPPLKPTGYLLAKTRLVVGPIFRIFPL